MADELAVPVVGEVQRDEQQVSIVLGCAATRRRLAIDWPFGRVAEVVLVGDGVVRRQPLRASQLAAWVAWLGGVDDA